MISSQTCQIENRKKKIFEKKFWRIDRHDTATFAKQMLIDFEHINCNDHDRKTMIFCEMMRESTKNYNKINRNLHINSKECETFKINDCLIAESKRCENCVKKNVMRWLTFSIRFTNSKQIVCLILMLKIDDDVVRWSIEWVTNSSSQTMRCMRFVACSLSSWNSRDFNRSRCLKKIAWNSWHAVCCMRSRLITLDKYVDAMCYKRYTLRVAKTLQFANHDWF